MPMSPEALYLDLLKKTLSFSLWAEPPVPLAVFNYSRPPLKRVAVSALSDAAHFMGIEVVKPRPVTEAERAEGRIWPSYAHTMIGMLRLDNLQFCVETVLQEGVKGDLIETGVWRGGACIFMKGVLAAHGAGDRRVFVADSFEGLPEPDETAHPQDRGDSHHEQQFLAVSEEEVRRNFESFGLLDENVVFVKGWFKDSLPNADIGPLAVLRLDGDMYCSTIDALNALYPKLSPGGFCIIDDFELPGCQAAVHDYRRDHQIEAELVPIDWMARYWRKP